MEQGHGEDEVEDEDLNVTFLEILLLLHLRPNRSIVYHSKLKHKG